MSKKPWEEVGMTEEDYNRAFQQLQSGFNQQKDKNTSILDKATFGTKGDVSRRAYEAASMSYDDFVQGDTYEELAKRYADKGKMAMQDTVGQVAARTGGIASSYATTAGNQAYQGWMEKLEETARAMYDSERQEAMDRYALSKGIYDSNNARADELRKQMQADEDRLAADAEAVATKASDEIVMRLGAGEPLDSMGDLIEKSGRSAGYWNAYATWLANQDLLEETPEETPVETVVPSYKYAYTGEKGAVYQDENGKEVVVEKGYNPYTRTRNPDIGEKGENAMDNGYQPDNIKGEKLRIWQADLAEADDGSELTVYVLGGHESMSKAQYYIWDEAENKYQLLTVEDLKKIGIDTSNFK